MHKNRYPAACPQRGYPSLCTKGQRGSPAKGEGRIYSCQLYMITRAGAYPPLQIFLENFKKTLDKCLFIVYNNIVAMGTAYGGIAQLARALGSYPGCHRFKSSYRHHCCSFSLGPLVKRLRHRPFTAESWVQFPYGSPLRKPSNSADARFEGFSFCLKMPLGLIWDLLYLHAPQFLLIQMILARLPSLSLQLLFAVIGSGSGGGVGSGVLLKLSAFATASQALTWFSLNIWL